VLNRVNFEIPAGSMVAIVGPSGAGKTTLMRLLLGLLVARGGSIEVDGTPLRPSNMTDWRRRIGAVMQDDYLPSGTLADNISFFAAEPDQQQIEAAARFARIHEDTRPYADGVSQPDQRHGRRAFERPAPAHPAGPRALAAA
jgi:ATP-binding cassette subfamily B protein RaxB